mmetsp:Transcript_36755/g.53737  ORF Transcript_36755/g.53737 Transcript_36755/m.53737 type:complete len:100 (-) Transcript_36755:281-580(-)
MTGPIPTEMGLLGDLTTLRINMNIISGEIPSELGLLQNVDTINFRENNLCGTVPQEICDLRTSGFLEDLQADCRNSKVECDCCTKCVKQKTPFCGAETA